MPIFEGAPWLGSATS